MAELESKHVRHHQPSPAARAALSSHYLGSIERGTSLVVRSTPHKDLRAKIMIYAQNA
jgi:hypothetical protein